MRFEWDPEKARSNRAKHSISFDEAKALFTSGVDYLEIYDFQHSVDEDRLIAIGPVGLRVICVVFTEPSEGCIRIISARAATNREKQLFSQFIAERGS